MMLDGKGAAIFLGLAALACMFIGLLVMWIFSLPWWVPLLGLTVPFVIAAVVMVLLLAGWMSSGSH